MSQTRNQPTWPSVVERLALIVTYGLGLVLTWLAGSVVAVLYAAVLVASHLSFIALICPYCRHCQELSCHSGFHHLARIIPPREGKTFDRQFSRYVAVMYPVWFLPPLAAAGRLLIQPDWEILAPLGIFVVAGFVVLPLASRRLCAGCANAADCPRGRRASRPPRSSPRPPLP